MKSNMPAVMYVYPPCTETIRAALDAYAETPNPDADILKALQIATKVSQSTNEVIKKYLDVMEALGFIDQNREMLHVDLLNDGKTAGKSHLDVLNKINNLCEEINKQTDQQTIIQQQKQQIEMLLNEIERLKNQQQNQNLFRAITGGFSFL